MEKSQMKNMVVLRNLPSNLIEEAFVVVKNNRTAKTLEYIENNEKINKNEKEKNTNDYIIREAESVITNYVSSIEKKDNVKKNTKTDKKIKILKYYSIFITVVWIISLIIWL